MSSVPCPSESWDRHVEEEERAQKPEDVDILEPLDAYGHLSYVVGFSDECSEDNICECPTVWAPGKPVESPTYTDGACTKCGGRKYRGDWLACFDFSVIHDGERVRVGYHVVVNSDSGGFIEGVEKGVVDADKAPYGLPDSYTEIGMEQGATWTDQEIKDAQAANERWNADLRKAIERAQTQGGKR